MAKKCGEPYSFAVGWGHEIGGTLQGQPVNEARMDSNNNMEGRKCSGEQCNSSDCNNCCLNKIAKRKLVWME